MGKLSVKLRGLIMTGTDHLEMEIFKLKDKISGLQFNFEVIEKQLAGLTDSVRILNTKLKDISQSIEGDNK